MTALPFGRHPSSRFVIPCTSAGGYVFAAPPPAFSRHFPSGTPNVNICVLPSNCFLLHIPFVFSDLHRTCWASPTTHFVCTLPNAHPPLLHDSLSSAPFIFFFLFPPGSWPRTDLRVYGAANPHLLHWHSLYDLRFSLHPPPPGILFFCCICCPTVCVTSDVVSCLHLEVRALSLRLCLYSLLLYVRAWTCDGVFCFTFSFFIYVSFANTPERFSPSVTPSPFRSDGRFVPCCTSWSTVGSP